TACRGIQAPLLLDQKTSERRCCHDPSPLQTASESGGFEKTRLALISASSSVTRSSFVTEPRLPRLNRRLACRSRARSSALRTERALAKWACPLRRWMYSWNVASAEGLK